MDANTASATVQFTLLGYANLLAPVTFSQSSYLLFGILRRWFCTISLLYFKINVLNMCSI